MFSTASGIVSLGIPFALRIYQTSKSIIDIYNY